MSLHMWGIIEEKRAVTIELPPLGLLAFHMVCLCTHFFTHFSVPLFNQRGVEIEYFAK